jgi:hypothetical protein
MVGLGKARALPWTRKGGDAPFDPINGWVNRRGQLGPLNLRNRPLLSTHPITGFQGPPALGGVRGGPSLARSLAPAF